MKIRTKTAKGVSGTIGAQGPIGPAGAQGAAGPQGAVGPAGVAGDDGLPYDIANGEPTLVYTQTTVIGDRYLDGVSGNVWERVVFANQFDDTHLVLPGNLTWKRVALLKGPTGPTGANGLPHINDITIITLNEDVKSQPDNIPRMRFESEATKLYRGVVVERDSSSSKIFSARLKDPDNDAIKEVFDVVAEVDSDNSYINFTVIRANFLGVGRYTLMRFDGEKQLITVFGLGVKIPSLTATEIANIPYIPDAGTVVFNSTIGEVCFHNGTSWRKFTSTAM